MRELVNGKIDIHGIASEYDAAIKELKTNGKWKHDANRLLVLEYLNACKKGQAKSGGKNKRVGKSTLYRLLGLLRMASERWIDKDFDKTTKADWDRFYDRMEDDKILSEFNKKYSQSTKSKIYRTLRKFLKWRYGENKYYPSFCDDWVTTEDAVTKEYLTRSEVEKMVVQATTSKIKCFMMMLFDGGFRIEEIANLRWVDVRKEEGKDYYRAEIRGETSKTKKPRVVSLWLSTDYIEAYRNSLDSKNITTEYMFDTTYNTLYKEVVRLGKRALNRKISPHTLRHSSATYYASIIKTYQQFCARYGWSLKSEAPQRYFHRVNDDEVASQTKDHEIAKFKTEFEREKLRNIQMEKRLLELQSELENVRGEVLDSTKEQADVKVSPELLKSIIRALESKKKVN